MNDSSSEGSADEDEVFKNFDEEAQIIFETHTLPRKSADRYLLVYTTYTAWKKENKHLLSPSGNKESNLVVYFKTLQAKLKPPTLWSIWSMLRKTLSTKENTNITNFLKLKCFIKNNVKDYKPRKAHVLRWPHIMKFIDEAVDSVYLAMKVVLVFGICGLLRCDEIVNMEVGHVEDLGSKYLVSIYNNKNDYAGQFVIGTLFYNKVNKYISLRPSEFDSNRFFIKYSEGKCFRQPIEIHKIGEIPSKIATFLGLSNANRYTGHCFKRTSATLLSDSGATMIQIKQLSRWGSDLIAQGYIENSLHNRELLYNGVIQNNTINLIPSTSACKSVQECTKSNTHLNEPINKEDLRTEASVEIIEENFNQSDFQLNWSDFSEDFDANLIPNGVNQNFSTDTNLNNKNLDTPNFITAAKKPILMPVPNENNQSSSSKNKLFFNKPGIKLNLNNNLSRDQVPVSKKQKITPQESIKDENFNNTHSVLKEHNLNFNNCTFNNCIFKITKDNEKENI